ncbi:MAG TPA: glycosyltransferase family 4 protein [Patescibacteria group bacterium]|nr:glycosyltransferase family 4 protein [Patescibacteria group bacterium]
MQRRNKHILIITHYFHPHIGGIELVAYNEAKALHRGGNSITIVSSKTGKEKSREVYQGITIRRIRVWNILETFFDIPFPIFPLTLFFLLKTEVKKSDHVIVHGILYEGSLFASLLAKRYKKSCSVIEHVGFVPYRNPIKNYVEKVAFATIGKLCLSYVTNIFVLNVKTKNFLSRLTQKNIAIISNGVDTDIFQPVTKTDKYELRKRNYLPVGKNLVLFVGRSVEKKGLLALIKAKTSLFDIILVTWGSVPEKIKKIPGIFIFPPMQQKNLAQLYQLCDIFVLPSKGEGFPLSVQEAMASKIPVITYKENIPSFDEKNPVCYAIHSSRQGIRNAIEALLTDKKLQESLRSNAYQMIHTGYSWKQHANSLMRI